MIPVSDKAMQTIEYALDALHRRSEVTAHNVANAETPGYLASKLSFEDQLRRAVASGNVAGLGDPTVVASNAPIGASGNNVNLEDEVVDMMKTNLLQNAMVEAFNFKTGLVKRAIQGA